MSVVRAVVRSRPHRKVYESRAVLRHFSAQHDRSPATAPVFAIDDIREQLDTIKQQKAVLACEEVRLREQLRAAIQLVQKQQQPLPIISDTNDLSPTELNEDKKDHASPAKQTTATWLKAKYRAGLREMYGYWLGLKLLYADASTAFGLVQVLLSGKSLTRRQYRQLVRTGTDIIRLIPTLTLLIVPAGEFALPILIRLFPNMLPSTFEDKNQKKEKAKKILKGRVAIAGFLQVMPPSIFLFVT